MIDEKTATLSTTGNLVNMEVYDLERDMLISGVQAMTLGELDSLARFVVANNEGGYTTFTGRKSLVRYTPGNISIDLENFMMDHYDRSSKIGSLTHKAFSKAKKEQELLNTILELR